MVKEYSKNICHEQIYHENKLKLEINEQKKKILKKPKTEIIGIQSNVVHENIVVPLNCAKNYQHVFRSFIFVLCFTTFFLKYLNIY